MLRVVISTVCLIAGASIACADEIDIKDLHIGADFKALCESLDEARQKQCTNINRAYLMAMDGAMKGANVCYFIVDRSLTAKEQRDVVLDYINAHPESKNANAFDVITDAFKDAYPCPKQ